MIRGTRILLLEMMNGSMGAKKRAGYRIDIVYLKLSSSRLALRRVAARVRQGGHNVPQADVLRRFVRGWEDCQRIYRPLADSWAVFIAVSQRAVEPQKWRDL